MSQEMETKKKKKKNWLEKAGGEKEMGTKKKKKKKETKQPEMWWRRLRGEEKKEQPIAWSRLRVWFDEECSREEIVPVGEWIVGEWTVAECQEEGGKGASGVWNGDERLRLRELPL